MFSVHVSTLKSLGMFERIKMKEKNVDIMLSLQYTHGINRENKEEATT